MSGILPVLRKLFPDKAKLTVEDVARVLGKSGAGGYEQTREQLASGVIVPGLRKLGGSWLVPVTALAQALDGLTEAVSPLRSTKALPTRHAVTRADPLVPRKTGRIPNRAKYMALGEMTSFAGALALTQSIAF